MRKNTVPSKTKGASCGDLFVSLFFVGCNLWRAFYLVVVGASLMAAIYTVENRGSISLLAQKDMVLMDNVTSLDTRIETVATDLDAVNTTLSGRLDTVETDLSIVNSSIYTESMALMDKISMVNATSTATDAFLQMQLDNLTLAGDITALEMRVTVNEGDIMALEAKDMLLMSQIAGLTSLSDMLVNDTMGLNTTVLSALMEAMLLEGRVDDVENKTLQNMMDIIALQSLPPGDGIGIGNIYSWAFGEPSAIGPTSPQDAGGNILLTTFGPGYASGGAAVTTGVDRLTPAPGYPSTGMANAILIEAPHVDGFGTSRTYEGVPGGTATRIDLDVAAGDGITISPPSPAPAGTATFSVNTGPYLEADGSGVRLRARTFRPSGIGDIDTLGTIGTTCNAEGQVAGPCTYPFGYVGGPWTFGVPGVPVAGCTNGFGVVACTQNLYSAAMITDQDGGATERYGVSSGNTIDWFITSVFRIEWQPGGGGGIGFTPPETVAMEFILNVVGGFEYTINNNALEFKPCRHVHHMDAYVFSADTTFYSDVQLTCHFTATEGPAGTAQHPTHTSVMGWRTRILGQNSFGGMNPPDLTVYYLKETITGLQSTADL